LRLRRRGGVGVGQADAGGGDDGDQCDQGSQVAVAGGREAVSHDRNPVSENRLISVLLFSACIVFCENSSMYERKYTRIVTILSRKINCWRTVVKARLSSWQKC
jgi:hypothetical protein